jgi:hypothetical protein
LILHILLRVVLLLRLDLEAQTRCHLLNYRALHVGTQSRQDGHDLLFLVIFVIDFHDLLLFLFRLPQVRTVLRLQLLVFGQIHELLRVHRFIRQNMAITSCGDQVLDEMTLQIFIRHPPRHRHMGQLLDLLVLLRSLR